MSQANIESRSLLASWASRVGSLAPSLCGVGLLVATVAKTHELATVPMSVGGLSASRWGVLALVNFESFLGFALLARLHPTWTRIIALCCFAAFAAVSGLQVLSGQQSCGCFGNLPVNPWFTFTYDLLACNLLFLWCRPENLSIPPPY